MPTPAAIRVVLDESEKAARLQLTSLAARGLEGIQEAAECVAAFGERQVALLTARLDGGLSPLEHSQCCEAEEIALRLNLASIKNETVRAEIGNILAGTARFLSNIIGAGLRALPGV